MRVVVGTDEAAMALAANELAKRQGGMLVVRDGAVRAFYNTCRHRGGPLVKDEAGRCEGFVCSYHGWSYTLDGRLINLRDRRDFVDLDLKCFSLVPLSGLPSSRRTSVFVSYSFAWCCSMSLES